MENRSSLPVIAILANMPLGRLLPEEFQDQDHTLIPWIYAFFCDLAHQKRYEIHWITLKKYVKAHTVRQLKGQTIHILPDPSLALGLLSGHFLASKRIRLLLHSLKPALVHAWGIEFPYAKACMNQPYSRLLSYQGALHAYCRESKMPFLAHLQAFWEKRTTPAYQHITCESPWAAECVRKLNPAASIHLIDYGIESESQEKKRAPSTRPSCLFAGSLNERKGLPFLIEAFKDPSLAHVDLYIAGNGKLRTKLNSECPPNIHWLGELSRMQLRQQMETAWCLLLPTLADTGPTIVKEARCMELPVITTVNAGSKQYVEDGKSGYILPVKDSEAIRQAVLAVTESLDKSIAMGKYGIEEIKRKLSIQTTSQDFMDVYGSLLDMKEENNTDS